MITISMASGLMSGMWIWADKPSDIRLSLNDVYMALLMTALMIFFMALLDKQYVWLTGSVLAVFITVWLIRTQRFIDKRQYFKGMIPHHSMAVHTSKRLLENDSTLSGTESQFVNNIIQTQNQEIQWMKIRDT
jgi:hypothetical protein